MLMLRSIAFIQAIGDHMTQRSDRMVVEKQIYPDFHGFHTIVSIAVRKLYKKYICTVSPVG